MGFRGGRSRGSWISGERRLTGRWPRIDRRKYERAPVPTSFTPFEARVRAILAEYPEMPATVIAERVDWSESITWFRDNVRLLRPHYRRPDPADRLAWEPGDPAQCDLWFPPGRIPLEDGSSALLPVLVIVAAHSRFITGRMLPTARRRICCSGRGS
jgi:hypothetical protein